MNNDNGFDILGDAAANVVENLAYRIAQQEGGRITVNHLAPYLPMSLQLIQACLERMVDGHAVIAEEANGFRCYTFSACREGMSPGEVLNVTTCLSCNNNFSNNNEEYFCPECSEVINQELNRLADRTAWPAQAVYEHEILFLAAKHGEKCYPAELASHSRYTLKKMQGKLKLMTTEGYLRQDLDEDNATLACRFPIINYPEDLFRKNMTVIRKYPASYTEDVEIKVTRIVLTLAFMLAIVFVLILLRFPLQIILPAFVIASLYAIVKILWGRKQV